MNLENPNYENMKFILDELSNRLDVANRSLMDPQDYDMDKYEDLKYMYEIISKKGSLSPAETQAFISELRAVRKG
ncbi:DUF1128 domain-containing protein [Virgibacillus sp. W0181]|uniref:DUF1128 domain-containing protein n=1 Tax=Virgibacillus sp. W0181 TaxID=3391581 RepID=UPI003F483DAE